MQAIVSKVDIKKASVRLLITDGGRSRRRALMPSTVAKTLAGGLWTNRRHVQPDAEPRAFPRVPGLF